ncbi:MAG: hypothetical protein FWC36_01035 [Spirochaetes bacterium]|nr:hypothetical protein [Spirochaetota bacterium]
MNWRLGLDLGTNSIAWVVLKLKEKKPSDFIDTGVRIFSDSREPAGEGRIGDPLAVARRTARGIRKNINRRKLRKSQLVKQLVEDGLFPKVINTASAAYVSIHAPARGATCDVYCLQCPTPRGKTQRIKPTVKLR